MPSPKATGSQGIRRPGATSAAAHCATSPRSHPAASVMPSGSNRPAGRPPTSGAQALAPTRCLPPLGLGRAIASGASPTLPATTCLTLTHPQVVATDFRSACGFLLGAILGLVLGLVLGPILGPCVAQANGAAEYRLA